MSKNYLLRLLLCFSILVFVSSPAWAERPGAANAEIEFLLQRVEKSGGRFARDGKEYAASEAVAHLRKKLSAAGDRVMTADDFIEGIATKSYLNGKPYYLILDGERKPTGPWLKKALEEKRAAK